MKRTCALVFILMFISSAAHADGGRLRFSRNTGPFIVTLFTTPEPLTPGPADFSVMVQDSRTNQVINDAAIQMHWTGPHGQAIQATALRGAATNKLLEAAEINLTQPGTWNLHIDVRDQSQSASCDAMLIVEPGSRQTIIIWIFALLPVLAVALFIVHQQQKHRVLTNATRKRSSPFEG